MIKFRIHFISWISSEAPCGNKIRENHKFEFHWIIKRDSEGYFNIFLRLFCRLIYLPSMKSTWSEVVHFLGWLYQNHEKYKHLWFGFLPRQTSLVGFFFSAESFIPLSWTTSADSAALQGLSVSSSTWSSGWKVTSSQRCISSKIRLSLHLT